MPQQKKQDNRQVDNNTEIIKKEKIIEVGTKDKDGFIYLGQGLWIRK